MSGTTPAGDASVERLRIIATQGKQNERIELARDPATPDEILDLLTQDEYMLVRDLAAKEKRRRRATNPEQGEAASIPRTSSPQPTSASPAPVATSSVGDPGYRLQQRLLDAQIATAMYLQAALALAFTVLAALGGLQQGNAAEARKALECLDRFYCSESGGEGWYGFALIALAIGTIFTIVLVLAAGSRLGSARK